MLLSTAQTGRGEGRQTDYISQYQHRYPKADAYVVALATFTNFLTSNNHIDLVSFVCLYRPYQRALKD